MPPPHEQDPPRTWHLGIQAISFRASIGVLTAGLLVLLVATATAGVVGRLQVAAAAKVLTGEVLPAQAAVAELTKAYVDQETGQRGYLLTGDPQLLQPFDAGRLEANNLYRQLETLLTDRDEAQKLVQQVQLAGAAWQSRSALFEIHRRTEGPISAQQLETSTHDGKVQFDELRSRLASLQQWTYRATTAQLEAIASAQRIANLITVSAVALALLSGLLSVFLTRQLVTRPLDQLVDQVAAVSSGGNDQIIKPRGPAELVRIGNAVEKMRVNLIDGAQTVQEVERELTLQREQERLAAELHGLTIRRLFGLSLSLSSLAQRHPRIRDEIRPLIHEADQAISETRGVIFDYAQNLVGHRNLQSDLLRIIDENATRLPCAPAVEFVGPVCEHLDHDTLVELRMVIDESFTIISRHENLTAITVRIEAAADCAVLTITENGSPAAADAPVERNFTALLDQANRLDRSVVVHSIPTGGTEVIWRIPSARIAPTEAAHNLAQSPRGKSSNNPTEESPEV